MEVTPTLVMLLHLSVHVINYIVIYSAWFGMGGPLWGRHNELVKPLGNRKTTALP